MYRDSRQDAPPGTRVERHSCRVNRMGSVSDCRDRSIVLRTSSSGPAAGGACDAMQSFRDVCEAAWRRDRDSNPGYLAVYTLSKRAPSATRPSLRCRPTLEYACTGTSRIYHKGPVGREAAACIGSATNGTCGNRLKEVLTSKLRPITHSSDAKGQGREAVSVVMGFISRLRGGVKGFLRFLSGDDQDA